MKRLLFAALLASISSTHCFAQNIVVNPSFEEMTACPSGYAPLNNLTNTGWHGASTEYYVENNTCTDPQFSYTNSYGGSQVPAAGSGNAYAGVRVSALNGIYRERIYGTLTGPLIPGIEYHFGFKASLGEGSSHCSSGLGIATMQNPLPPEAAIQSALPSYHSIGSDPQFVCDQENWTEVAGSFIATAPDEHFMLGGMTASAQTQYLGPPDNFQNSYYFIDEVSITCSHQFQFQVDPTPPCGAKPIININSNQNVAFVTWKLVRPDGVILYSTILPEPGTTSLSITQLFPPDSILLNGTYQLSVVSGCHEDVTTSSGVQSFYYATPQPAPIPEPVSVLPGEDLGAYFNFPYDVPNGVSLSTPGSGQSVYGTYTDEHGCVSPVQIPITVLPKSEEQLEAEAPRFFAPNAFSPNGDGINEAWFPEGQNVDYDLKIFNRWGAVVFQVTNIPIEESARHAWLGDVNDGNHTEQGVYVFQARYRSRSTAEAKEVQGTITLIR